jgi:hypothetical protein
MMDEKDGGFLKEFVKRKRRRKEKELEVRIEKCFSFPGE